MARSSTRLSKRRWQPCARVMTWRRCGPSWRPSQRPDGVRPSVLAERAGTSKQAMNQLLNSLERLTYITRADAGGRARVVRLTERGHAVEATILETLRRMEEEWRAELGEERFAQLKALLIVVWQSSLTDQP